MKSLKTTMLLTATMTLMFGSSAYAGAIVGVDFGTAGDPQTTPTNWTFAAPADGGGADVFANLIDETGANSGWTLTTDNEEDLWANRISSFPAAEAPQHSNSLVGLNGSGVGPDDYDADVTATWSGLTPGAMFNFWVFSLGANDFEQSITVSGGSAPVTFSDDRYYGHLNVNGSAGSDANTLASYAMQQTADVSGKITILYHPLTSSDISLGGVAIQQVPEPATLSLLGLGGLTLVRRRKTHR
jgi:hypothetical protein